MYSSTNILSVQIACPDHLVHHIMPTTIHFYTPIETTNELRNPLIIRLMSIANTEEWFTFS